MKQWISKLRIENLRSFSSAELEFSPGINILIGRNNSGKSTILQSILLLQSPVLAGSDIRSSSGGNLSAFIEIHYLSNQIDPVQLGNPNIPEKYTISTSGFSLESSIGSRSSGVWIERFQSVEPNNLIYPYLSKRKVGGFSEQINQAITTSVQ